VRISPGQGKAVIRALVAAAALGALLGCGPVQSTASLLDAKAQLESARAAGAEKYAPYEWTAAQLYLHKAREEAGRSVYQKAIDFADKASQYATRARAAARVAAKSELGKDAPVRP
jgi:hypothetical protein